MSKILTLIFVLSLCIQSLLAAVYYVSPTGNNLDAGSQAAPFLTIQYGIDQLNPGDNLFILSGTYSEKVLIENLQGNPDQPNLIKGIGSVIIDGNTLTPIGKEVLLTIRNSSYVTVANIEIQNFQTSGGATPMGILVEGSCNDIAIIGNRVHAIRNNSTCTNCEEGAHGIGVFGITASGIQNIVLSYNEVYDNVLQSSEAFVVNGTRNFRITLPTGLQSPKWLRFSIF